MRTALLCLIAASAVANWWTRLPGDRRSDRVIEMITKPLTTVLVGVLALTSGAPTDQVVLAVVAIGWCLVGDVALMEPFDQFLVGLGAFLVAHVLFIVVFVRFGLHHPPLAIAAGVGAAAVAVTVGRTIVRGARATEPALSVPVVAYLLVILTMAVVGWATGRAAVLVGASAFVVSDALLGWEAFVRRNRWQPLAVMVTYHLAITSLALAL